MILSQGYNIIDNKYKAEKENNKDSNHDININNTTKIIHKISLFKIFVLNKGPDITDIEKL